MNYLSYTGKVDDFSKFQYYQSLKLKMISVYYIKVKSLFFGQ